MLLTYNSPSGTEEHSLLSEPKEKEESLGAPPHPINGKVELNYTQNKSIRIAKVVASFASVGAALVWLAGWLSVFRIQMVSSPFVVLWLGRYYFYYYSALDFCDPYYISPAASQA